MPPADGTLAFGLPGGRGATGLVLDGHGRIATVTGADEIGQSLLMLMATRPGERRLNPAFGCPLDLIAFEPNDATTAGLAIRLVADAVSRFEPRAEILALDAFPDPSSGEMLVIELSYRDRRDGATGTVTHLADLSGAG